MEHSHATLAVCTLGVALVLAGCLPGTGAPTPTDALDGPTPTTSADPSTGTTTAATAATATPPAATNTCANWVAFYGLGDPGDVGWATDRVVVGYTVPGDASVFLVALAGEAVVGTTHVTTGTYGVTADGDGVALDRPLSGAHTVRVRAYADTDGDGRFDRGTDRPCREDGKPVEAGPRRIDFDALAGTASG